jgi:hypothetical protein
MNEIIFHVDEAPEGGYIARALGEAIFTEADDIESLYRQVRDAVLCHFDEDSAPKDHPPALRAPGSNRAVRLPRSVSGPELAKALQRLGYEVTRQTGSHMRLTTNLNGQASCDHSEPFTASGGYAVGDFGRDRSPS